MSNYIGQPILLEKIVAVIGEPHDAVPYVSPYQPGVPTGATEERWRCGCRAVPAGFGATKREWRRDRCRAGHDRLDVDMR